VNRTGFAILFWSAGVTVWEVVLAVWSPWDWLANLTLAGAAATGWLIGVAAILARSRRDTRVVPDLSLSTVLLAGGLTLLLCSALLGLWLALLGGGVVLVALAGILAEARAR
jgi:hypothetical protein